MQEWARRDSNPEPRDYESPALTVELQALLLIMRDLRVFLKSQLDFVQEIVQEHWRETQRDDKRQKPGT